MGRKRSEALDQLTFEDALAQLEAMVRDLEDGQIGLEESLMKYEQAVRILQQCHGKLQEAEQRIQLLTGVDEEGKPVLKAFRHEATFTSSGKSDIE